MTQEHVRSRDQEQQQDINNEARGGSNNKGGRSTAEWTTLGISLTIVLSILGLITYLYVSGSDEPPNIAAEAKFEELRRETSGYYLPVEVINEGDRTAEDVRVEAELDTGNGQPETAEIAVTFLAGGEHATGTFIFNQDPSEGDLTVQAISYTIP